MYVDGEGATKNPVAAGRTGWDRWREAFDRDLAGARGKQEAKSKEQAGLAGNRTHV